LPPRNGDGYPGGFRPQGNFTLPGAGNQPIAQTNSFSYAPPVAEQSEARNWFMAIDQNGDGELSHDELCSALLNNGYTRFSGDTVKYLMITFDQDGNGVITFDEFEPLWEYMNQWIQMFDSFDQNRDGIINTTELSHALANYGLHLTRDVLDMVMDKYGDVPSRNRRPGFGGVPPHMNLDGFVSACVGVHKMCDLHRDCSPQGQPRMSRDAFLKAVLSLP
jgi:Ca2+-binding EF-hand superfamily protein